MIYFTENHRSWGNLPQPSFPKHAKSFLSLIVLIVLAQRITETLRMQIDVATKYIFDIKNCNRNACFALLLQLILLCRCRFRLIGRNLGNRAGGIRGNPQNGFTVDLQGNRSIKGNGDLMAGKDLCDLVVLDVLAFK